MKNNLAVQLGALIVAASLISSTGVAGAQQSQQQTQQTTPSQQPQ